MKIRARVKHLLLGVVLLGGLVYSVLALNVRPAYAAGCDCSDDYNEAVYFCDVNYGYPGVNIFSCSPSGTYYLFTCQNDPLNQRHFVQCID
jgi:hypothetical protein